MNYKYIVNPITHRKVKTTTKLGQRILNNYIITMRGGGLDIITKHKDNLKDLANKQVNKIGKEAMNTLNETAKDTKKKLKTLADKEYWTNLDNETKCEFCANLGETVCKNIYSDKIETIKNLIQEADQLNKMQQMHIKNENFERAIETRDQRIDILKNAHSINNNIPDNKKVSLPEIPVIDNKD
jgi:hypothetical protein